MKDQLSNVNVRYLNYLSAKSELSKYGTYIDREDEAKQEEFENRNFARAVLLIVETAKGSHFG